jgi:hypothetical protein
MSAETQVRANSNLNFRAAGSKGAKVLCVVMKGVLIEQTSARNINGFAKGIVHTYRTGNEMFTVADSLSRSLFVEVRLGAGAVFVADKPIDEFGRVFGHVEGWFYAPFTTAVTPQEFVP